MEWLTDIIGVGTAAASGGLFGVLGSAFGAWMKAKERKAQAIERAAERKHQLDLIGLQMQAKSQGASWDALTTTHQAEIQLNGQENYKSVIAAKSLFRPVLTLLLWVLTAWELHMLTTGAVNDLLFELQQGQVIFTSSELVDLIRYVVYSTVFSATTATTWWFGERALSLPEYKNR